MRPLNSFFTLTKLAVATALLSHSMLATADSNTVRISPELEQQVIKWRRDFHQHPELSNREFRTARVVAEQLESFGLEVQTGIAHTGVVAMLRGGKPGPTIALRADMDALPVVEQTDVPFKSVAIGEYRGRSEERRVGK